MENTPLNFQRFTNVLINMGILFCDEMSTPRIKGYWNIMRNDFEIDEWEGVGLALMREKDLRHVPMPFVFLDRLLSYQREHGTTPTGRFDKRLSL